MTGTQGTLKENFSCISKISLHATTKATQLESRLDNPEKAQELKMSGDSTLKLMHEIAVTRIPMASA